MAESIQRRLTRERPPRVKITYDVETGGAIVKTELPFVMGVIADLSGARDGVTRDGKRVAGVPADEPEAWPKIAWQDYGERAFVDIDKDNFNDVLAEFAPRLKYKAGEDFTAKLGVYVETAQSDKEMAFHHLNDFLPDSIVKTLNPLKGALEARNALRDLYTTMDMDGNLLAICYSHVMDLAMTFGGKKKPADKAKKGPVSMDSVKAAIDNAVREAIGNAPEGTFSGIGKTETAEEVAKEINTAVENAIKSAESKAKPDAAQAALDPAMIASVAEEVKSAITDAEKDASAADFKVDSSTDAIKTAVEAAIQEVLHAAIDDAVAGTAGEARRMATAKDVGDAIPGTVNGNAVTAYFAKRKAALKEAMKDSAKNAEASRNIEAANPRALIQALTRDVSEIDAIIAAEMNAIHGAEFKKLEASWRGLFYLVKNTATGTGLKLKVFNASEDELYKDLTEALDFDQSRLFKMVYEETYGTQGGNPYSCLLHDQYYDKDSRSMTLAGKMTEVAAAAHAPLLAAADPRLFNLISFKDLATPRDLSKIFESAAHTEWRSLREREDSRYLTMCLPHILMRAPYAKADVASFEYEEKLGGVPTAPDHDCYLWGNAAYALGARITEAFSLYGWTAAIRGMEGGGLVEDIPLHSYIRASGDTVTKIPTETAITDRREKELSDLGFISLCYRLGTDKAVFFGGQTVNKPLKYLEDDATANANLSCPIC